MTAVHAITTTAGHTVLAGAAVEQLKASLRGELLLPDDDRYEETRRVWNGMVDKRPALIARCAGVADVSAAVTFARQLMAQSRSDFARSSSIRAMTPRN